MAKMELCVFCHKHPIDPAFRPFCSKRCQIQDLARWADGRYRVPAEPVPVPGESDEGTGAKPKKNPARATSDEP